MVNIIKNSILLNSKNDNIGETKTLLENIVYMNPNKQTKDRCPHRHLEGGAQKGLRIKHITFHFQKTLEVKALKPN